MDTGMAPTGVEYQIVRLVRGILMIKPRSYIAKTGLLVSVAYFFACGASAGEWRVKSGLNVGQVYTDNVELDDDDKESKFVSVVRPTFNLVGKGNRANVSFISAFEFNNSGSGADSFSPKISATADAELLEDVLFIDADLSSNQSTIDPFAAAGNSQLNQSDNVTTTYDYSISPYVVKHFGQTADLRVRYTYDDQINKGDELSDSVQQSILATLQSGRDFSRLTWKLESDYQDTDYESDESSSEQDGNSEKWSNSLTLGYKVNRKFELRGTIGKEWNNYQTFDDDDTDDKTFEDDIGGTIVPANVKVSQSSGCDTCLNGTRRWLCLRNGRHQSIGPDGIVETIIVVLFCVLDVVESIVNGAYLISPASTSGWQISGAFYLYVLVWPFLVVVDPFYTFYVVVFAKNRDARYASVVTLYSSINILLAMIVLLLPILTDPKQAKVLATIFSSDGSWPFFVLLPVRSFSFTYRILKMIISYSHQYLIGPILVWCS